MEGEREEIGFEEENDGGLERERGGGLSLSLLALPSMSRKD